MPVYLIRRRILKTLPAKKFFAAVSAGVGAEHLFDREPSGD
jgi:hypothetical protein